MTLDATHRESTSAPAAPWIVGGRAWVRALRPRQWVKNTFVLAPLLFSGKGLELTSVARAASAFALFCMLASAVYLMNDLLDRESDRVHPIKRRRPIASGEISGAAALTVAATLATVGIVGAAVLDPWVAALGVLYLVLNLAYSTFLKRVVILDVFTIAAFFVIRLLVGTTAVAVAPSIWLLLCGGLLALYLSFAKRRHELLVLEDASPSHRPVLAQYSIAFLDQLSVVLLAVTVVAYIMYTLDSETARAVGSPALTYSAVFVLYGVIRYLYLVHQREGGDPAESLLADRSLLVSGVLWVLYCGIVIYGAS